MCLLFFTYSCTYLFICLFIFIHLPRTTILCIYTRQLLDQIQRNCIECILEHLLRFTPPFFHPLPQEPFRYRSTVETTLILANGVLYLVQLRAASFCVAALRAGLTLPRTPSTTEHTDFLTNKK